MQAKILKLVPSCTTAGIVIWYNPFRIQFSNIHRESKKKKFMLFNPEILLLGTHPKEIISNKEYETISQVLFIIIARN